MAYAVAFSSAKRASPVENDAAMIRSGLRPAKSCTRPPSSSPTRASPGSRRSSMNTENCSSGLVHSIGIALASNPSASVGTTNSTGFTLPVLASSVRATTSTLSASSTPEMKILRPFSTHSSPSLRATVLMLWVLVPASGSVIANAMVPVPSQIPGSQRCFCSSVP